MRKCSRMIHLYNHWVIKIWLFGIKVALFPSIFLFFLNSNEISLGKSRWRVDLDFRTFRSSQWHANRWKNAYVCTKNDSIISVYITMIETVITMYIIYVESYRNEMSIRRRCAKLKRYQFSDYINLSPIHSFFDKSYFDYIPLLKFSISITMVDHLLRVTSVNRTIRCSTISSRIVRIKSKTRYYLGIIPDRSP